MQGKELQEHSRIVWPSNIWKETAWPNEDVHWPRMPLLQRVTSGGWNITSAGEKWIKQHAVGKEFGVRGIIYQERIWFSKQSTRQSHQSHFQATARLSLSVQRLGLRSAGGNLQRAPVPWGQLRKTTREAVLTFFFMWRERSPPAPAGIKGTSAYWQRSGTLWGFEWNSVKTAEVKRAYHKSAMTHRLMSLLPVKGETHLATKDFACVHVEKAVVLGEHTWSWVKWVNWQKKEKKHCSRHLIFA